MKLVLVAFIVSVGLTSVQPNNEMETDPYKIQGNFHELFNSMNKNVVQRTEMHRNFLAQEAVRERQAFDTVKEEWQSMRQRNAHEQWYLNGGGKSTAFKREAAQLTRQRPPNYNTKYYEDKFVEKYGNDNVTAGLWEPVRDILEDNEKIINICRQAHERFFGRLPDLQCTGFYIKQLNFPNSPQYQPMDLDMLVYMTKFNYEAPRKPYLFHFTKGQGPDCIYYLRTLDPYKLTVQLLGHVCGMKFPF